MAQTRMRRRILLATLTLAVAALVWILLRPAPVLVEVSKATRGPMRVTVNEDGETRAHDRFVVAAPIPGRMLRIELEEGDAIRANQVVVRIEPLPLNQQQREEVLGRVESAEAAKRQAEARAEHAREDYEQSRRDRERAENLAREKVISAQALEQARNAAITSSEELKAAKFSALAADSEVKVASAGLVGIGDATVERKVVSLHAPVAGRVLRIAGEERASSPGWRTARCGRRPPANRNCHGRFDDRRCQYQARCDNPSRGLGWRSAVARKGAID